MEFWRYYRVLRRRRWIIAAALLAAIVVGLALGRRSLGDYEATATVAVPSAQRFFFVTGAAGSQELGESAAARLGLALGLFRSYDIAERTVERLRLNMTPADLQRAIRADKDRDPNTYLIKVTVNGRTPREAVMLTNAVADTAAAYNQDVQRQQVTLAREFLERQVDRTEADLRVAEGQLLAFQQQNGLALAASKGGQMANFNTAMQQTEFAIQENQAKVYAVLGRMNRENVFRTGNRQITLNPVAQQLRSDLVQQEVALTSELAVHTEKHPSVVALKTKIDAIKERLKAELTNIVSGESVTFNPVYDSLNQTRINLEAEQIALLAKKEALRRAIGEAARAFPTLAQMQSEQTRLTRAVDILTKQLAAVRTQVADARLREQQAQNLGALDVLDHARRARPSLFHGYRFKLTLAALLGLLGGVGLAFFQEYLDDTLKTPEEAERLVGVPALAAVPRHNPPFHEAYRLLRTNLAAHTREDGPDTFLVTSPRPREGTSTVVANLGRAFARAGQRTIIVDAAFQHPSQHVHFSVANDKGLAEVLTGATPLQDTLQKTDVPNLSVLPTGVTAENFEKLDATAGFLSSQGMAGVLSELKRIGDVILLDTPPAGAFSDVLDIAPLASGVLIVLDASRAPRGVVEQVKVGLDRVGAKVPGIVLTKVRPDFVDSYVYQERFYRRAPRREITPATATAAALVLGISLGMLTGTGVRPAQNGGDLLAIPRAQIRWFSSVIHRGRAEVQPLPDDRRGGPVGQRTSTQTVALPVVDQAESRQIGRGVAAP